MAPLRIKATFSGNVRVCGEPSHQHRILTDALDGNVAIVGLVFVPDMINAQGEPLGVGTVHDVDNLSRRDAIGDIREPLREDNPLAVEGKGSGHLTDEGAWQIGLVEVAHALDRDELQVLTRGQLHLVDTNELDVSRGWEWQRWGLEVAARQAQRTCDDCKQPFVGFHASPRLKVDELRMRFTAGCGD